MFLQMRRDFGGARLHLDRAVLLSPGDVETLGYTGLEYAYAGQSPEIKRQIVDMALNASGIRDTARVLHVSPTTVIKELKKKNLISSR